MNTVCNKQLGLCVSSGVVNSSFKAGLDKLWTKEDF